MSLQDIQYAREGREPPPIERVRQRDVAPRLVGVENFAPAMRDRPLV